MVAMDGRPVTGLGPGIERPILTPENIATIRHVLADPAHAWRADTVARKAANARLRGIVVPAGGGAEAVDDALELAMGDDDTVPWSWIRRSQRVADAVARISQPLPATGFLVSDQLLLTNHHVLPTAEVAAGAHADFRYEEDENGAINPVRVRFDPDTCFLTGSADPDGLDFTLVAVRPLADGTPPGATFGRVPLIGTVGKALIGRPLNIVQHPDGLPRRVAFRDNPLLSLDDPIHLIYRTDTKHGSSGSPVFNDEWQLVAVHQRAESARNADGVEVDSLGRPVTDDTPPHLREWVANAGIRVSAVVNHLRDLPLDPPLRALVDAALR
jgi:endonuclease G, mitochondrial